MEKSLSLAAAVAVVAVSLLLLASLLLSLVSRPKADKAATAATTEEVVVDDHLVGHGGTTSIGHGNALGAFESRGCKMISSRCSILSTILRLKVK